MEINCWRLDWLDIEFTWIGFGSLATEMCRMEQGVITMEQTYFAFASHGLLTSFTPMHQLQKVTLAPFLANILAETWRSRSVTSR